MTSGAAQNQFVIEWLVDEQPVRFDMAFPPVLPVAGQWMIMKLLGEDTARNEEIDGSDQLAQVLSPLLLFP